MGAYKNNSCVEQIHDPADLPVCCFANDVFSYDVRNAPQPNVQELAAKVVIYKIRPSFDQWYYYWI